MCRNARTSIQNFSLSTLIFLRRKLYNLKKKKTIKLSFIGNSSNVICISTYCIYFRQGEWWVCISTCMKYEKNSPCWLSVKNICFLSSVQPIESSDVRACREGTWIFKVVFSDGNSKQFAAASRNDRQVRFSLLNYF